MDTALFNFHDQLDDFLAKPRRGGPVVASCKGNPTVKHLIEALGVPHVEVGLVTVNGKDSGLGYRVQAGDRVEIRPSLPGCPVEARFLLDNHLGRLAVYLRMLGFDCLYRSDYQDAQLAEIAAAEKRILLTRDRRLLMRKVVEYGYCPRALEPELQLKEVVHHFDLADRILPFQRCLRCNGKLEPVSKADVLERLEPLTKKYYDEFCICLDCDQIYWKGSHYDRMLGLIERIQHSP
ncbi:MAG: Mut7-C RNAse domain-containing protein [Anaerolineales bacterium]